MAMTDGWGLKEEKSTPFLSTQWSPPLEPMPRTSKRHHRMAFHLLITC